MSRQSAAQREQMIRDFVAMRKGQLVDAMTMTYGIRDHWGIDVDWHDVAEVLGRMEQHRILTINARRDHTQYIVE